MSETKWMQWSELPWLLRSELASPLITLCDRVLQLAATSDTAALLQQFLPEVATEFSAQWISVAKRSPEWSVIGEFGRNPLDSIPVHVLDEVLDRESAGSVEIDSAGGCRLTAVPLSGGRHVDAVLVMAGRHLADDLLPAALVIGRALGLAIRFTTDRTGISDRVDRLRGTLKIASEFASTRESKPLLELIAGEATRLVDCDRASIFIWDREHHEVVACPALGVEGDTLRIPDNTGLVGEVLKTGRSTRMDDCYSDPRFNRSVDEASGYTTRNMLCWPLRDADGELIGAFEVINKNNGLFTDDDEESVNDLAIQAAIAIQNTREREQLIRSREQLTEQVTQGVQIIGESPAIAALRTTLGRLAETDLPVLILGESGTGKEVVSQALHYQGTRAANPFVAVNCAALTETLLESELFGHEKGAFTDAHETRPGKFELAEGGTIFLDEIGDMSLGGQAKLLRVLEQKVVTRVGGSQPIPINVRVIAATNANLLEAVRNKKFREDLFFRLNVVTQNLPALRERPEDILVLAEHFLREFCVQARRAPLKLSAEARRRLQAHSWPGNIRELRNLMERVAFLCAGDKVETDDLAFILSPDKDDVTQFSPDMGLAEATDEFQKDYIRQAVKRVRGNMSEAARLLGLHRSNLYRKIRQLEMEDSEFS